MSLSLLWALLIKDPLIILATIVMGSISVAVSFFDAEGRWTDRIARRWARMLLGIAGVRLRVRGLENIDAARNYVFAGNHLSLMDTPVVLAAVPARFLFLVNAKYVRLPFLGTHLRRCGHFSVPEGNARASLRAMTEAARTARARNLSILVFPEGSRSPAGLEQFKEGAAYIAIKAGVPIIPFAINGTREVLPIGSIHVRGGPVELVFGRPIPTGEYALKDRARLNQLLFSTVAGMLAELRGPGA